MHTIDTETVGDFTVAVHYDEYAENPQRAYDHAAVIVPFRRAYWQHSSLVDQVPATYLGIDKLNHKLTNLDPFADDCDPAGFAEWCAEVTAIFGPDAYVAFVAYEDYGSNGARVYLTDDPMPLLDTEATWQAIVEGTHGERADGCIVVSPFTAPGTDIDAYADIVRGDCAELTAYLSGDSYYWTVTDTTTGEIVQSCAGYYDLDDAAGAALAEAEWYADERDRTLAWLRAEAEWRCTVPDVATVLAAHRTLDLLDDLAAHEPA